MRTRPLAALFLFASLGMAQQGRKIDDAALKNAPKTGEEWLACGLDLGEL